MIDNMLEAIRINAENRRDIMQNCSRVSNIIYDKGVSGFASFPLRNVGLLTHITLELDFKRIIEVSLCDFNNMWRIKVPPYSLPRHRNTILLPVASTRFDRGHIEIIDLRGAMYMNCCGADAYLTITGHSDKLLVKQHYYDMLPINKNGPVIPVLDLSQINQYI